MTNNIFSGLPELMKQILLHDENAEINGEIREHFQLSQEQGISMMGIIRNVILQHIQPSGLVQAFQTDMKLDEEVAKKMALELLGRRFLVMEWYLGGVTSEIQKLGGDVAVYEAEARKNYPEVYQPKLVEPAVRIPELLAMLDHIPSPYDDEGNPKPDQLEDEAVAVGQTERPSASMEGQNEKPLPVILQDIEEKLATPKGRAGVLLHLVSLSQQIEDAEKDGTITAEQSSQLLHGLDALSYAVNTQDLNPLEIAAIKRRLKNIMAQIGR